MSNIRKREFINNVPADLVPALQKIWNAIGTDVTTDDHELSNIDKIEVCLDADRLHSIADRPDINNWVTQIAREGHHHDLVMQLADNVRL